MQNPPYFPTRNADQSAWATNFSTLITANPTNYGLTAPDAVLIDAAVDSFVAALATATNPATRTPVSIAAKDAALANMKSVVFPYATQISRDESVSNALKTGVGVTVAITTRTRNPITTNEIVNETSYTLNGAPRVRTADPSTPASSKRPLGAIGFQIQVRGWDDVTPVVYETVFDAVYTKPLVTLDSTLWTTDAKDFFSYRTRWVGADLSGGARNVGPWSGWQDINVPVNP